MARFSLTNDENSAERVGGLGNPCSIQLSYGAIGSFPSFPPFTDADRTTQTRNEGLIDMTQEVAQSVPDLIALAERCEQAIGPDCEIDRDMWLAIYGEGLASCRRAYTASLDAAQSLVPERWSISLHAHYGGESRASVYSGPMASGFCFGDTPALSLCAAALRARAEITRLQGVSL